jgi:hypothetical protein
MFRQAIRVQNHSEKRRHEPPCNFISVSMRLFAIEYASRVVAMQPRREHMRHVMSIAVPLGSLLVGMAQARPVFKEGDYNYRGVCMFAELVAHLGLAAAVQAQDVTRAQPDPSAPMTRQDGINEHGFDCSEGRTFEGFVTFHNSPELKADFYTDTTHFHYLNDETVTNNRGEQTQSRPAVFRHRHPAALQMQDLQTFVRAMCAPTAT